MKEIKLQNSKKKAKVDDDNYHWLNKHKWYLIEVEKEGGRKMEYAGRFDENNDVIFMHDEVINRHSVN